MAIEDINGTTRNRNSKCTLSIKEEKLEEEKRII